ncbi:unnamed protein product [Chondrus crispus]|uniref:Uncharacterized protein n=1 Tax=Chondrus crispus TaxID=2769 RepID=R7QP91_CHOCR|nr:unnamed protein product [Chondrus crispus]CDF39301.1 unnamed protein product [Chondrus crispus]|eukprot:XP_005719212.1 unnamed protein product [Chondrus crispus]
MIPLCHPLHPSIRGTADNRHNVICTATYFINTHRLNRRLIRKHHFTDSSIVIVPASIHDHIVEDHTRFDKVIQIRFVPQLNRSLQDVPPCY